MRILVVVVPVSRYAPWEMHTLSPIVTSTRLSIQEPSPIQQCFPMRSARDT